MINLRRGANHKRNKIIAVDVDGTLFIRGILNNKLVAWCKKKKLEAFYLILWSSRGAKHALEAAKIAGLSDTFDTIIGKPGYIVDNKGWSWIKFTQVVRKLNI